jgi:transcriptional regulator GlxA family with amidase domain
VVPKYSFANVPPIDVLLIPGGQGTRPLLNDEPALAWIRARAASAELVLSVCTGALLLGRCGLLDGLSATTHHLALDLLRELAPKSSIRDHERVVDNGRLVTSAGVAAGIDMSFHVLARLLGHETAEKTARYIEYPWPRQATG